MPIDLQEREWNAWEDETSVPRPRPSRQAPAPEVYAISAAVDLLAGARRPVIIAGSAGWSSPSARSRLSLVGDRVGALFATTLRGKGVFSGHPFALGIAGGLGSNLGVQLIGEADVVLVVGAGMNDFTMMRGHLLAESARVIRCDIDPDGWPHRPGRAGSARRRHGGRGCPERRVASRAATATEGYRPRASKQLDRLSPGQRVQGRGRARRGRPAQSGRTA